MTRLRLTAAAQRDLDEIWLYIARDSEDAVSRFVDEIVARFALLRSTPELGRARDELKPGLRSHPVENYVIYYRQKRDTISVLRIVHGARDPRRVFR
jgi:toxin ParE1/3/4